MVTILFQVCFAAYLMLSGNQAGNENYVILNMYSMRKCTGDSNKAGHLEKLLYLSDILRLHRTVMNSNCSNITSSMLLYISN